MSRLAQASGMSRSSAAMGKSTRPGRDALLHSAWLQARISHPAGVRLSSVKQIYTRSRIMHTKKRYLHFSQGCAFIERGIHRMCYSTARGRQRAACYEICHMKAEMYRLLSIHGISGSCYIYDRVTPLRTAQSSNQVHR